MSDLRNFTVSNRLIYFGLLGTIYWKLIPFNVNNFILWGVGLAIPIVILFPFFIWKVLGSGDIKVCAVISSFYGITFFIRFILSTFMIGAVLSLLSMIYQKNLWFRLHHLAEYIQKTMKSKKIEPYYIVSRDGRSCVIPFTLAIYAAFFVCQVFPNMGHVW